VGLGDNKRITLQVGPFPFNNRQEYKLLEEIAFNNYGCSSKRLVNKKNPGMYDLDGINMLNAKVDNLAKIFSEMNNKPSWELAIEKLANAPSESFIKLENKVDQLATSNKNIEIQIGQQANAINSRSQGSLPSKTDVNLKEQCNAVTLRNCKESDEVNNHSK
ncbi:(+)-alpha-pinene synthase chloroplastic, partial [Bienertia sinuspersici]